MELDWPKTKLVYCGAGPNVGGVGMSITVIVGVVSLEWAGRTRHINFTVTAWSVLKRLANDCNCICSRDSVSVSFFILCQAARDKKCS